MPAVRPAVPKTPYRMISRLVGSVANRPHTVLLDSVLPHRTSEEPDEVDGVSAGH
jgi:hypothetical protein